MNLEQNVSNLFKDVDGVFIIYYPINERVFYYENEGNKSLSYDLIVKGLEITSGGIRTSNREKLVNKMKAEGININRYKPYIELFNKSPVHGGFGIGLERLLSRYLDIKDIAEVNPFSKKPNTTGDDLIWK